MLTFGKPAARIQSHGLVDFGRQVRPAVLFQHRVAEILDAQAQPRHAQVAQRMDLRLRQRPRLALERDFLGVVPADVGPQAVDQRSQLLGAEERGRAAAEIDKPKRPVSHHRQPAHQFDLARQGRHIGLDVRRRSCRCRRGNNKTCNACGKTECADTAPAARRPAATRAPRGPPSTRRASTAKTADSSR